MDVTANQQNMSDIVEDVSNQEDSSEDTTLPNHLATQIQSKYDSIQHFPYNALGTHRIVSRIDHSLYDVNPFAYYPRHVIIGPLICQHIITEYYEVQKWTYLASLQERAERRASLMDFCKLIKDSAHRIYDCYMIAHERTWDFQSHKIQQLYPVRRENSEVIMEMVLVDATFIIELFLRVYEKKGRYDSIFQRDLLLAQNQLPMFILKDLYQLACADANPAYPSFLKLTCHFFGPYYNQNISIDDIINSHSHAEYKDKLESAKHFTDLLRMLQLPYPSHKDHSSKQKSFWSKWIRNRAEAENLEETLESGRVQDEYLYSAVLLRDAGVKFKASTSRCLLDIEFDERNGDLRIPPLRVDGNTETFFRNLIAWEQCQYSHETYVTDYIFLMEDLIQSTEDVELLVRKRIIINQVGSNAAVLFLFSNFGRHVTRVEENSYSDTFKKLNRYNAVRHHSWIAILRLQYFSTLWRGVATVAAIILLALTLIQTICAIISL